MRMPARLQRRQHLLGEAAALSVHELLGARGDQRSSCSRGARVRRRRTPRAPCPGGASARPRGPCRTRRGCEAKIARNFARSSSGCRSVLRQRQHPLVEVQPAELPVEEPVGRQRISRAGGLDRVGVRRRSLERRGRGATGRGRAVPGRGPAVRAFRRGGVAGLARRTGRSTGGHGLILACTREAVPGAGGNTRVVRNIAPIRAATEGRGRGARRRLGEGQCMARPVQDRDVPSHVNARPQAVHRRREACPRGRLPRRGESRFARGSHLRRGARAHVRPGSAVPGEGIAVEGAGAGAGAGAYRADPGRARRRRARGSVPSSWRRRRCGRARSW